VWESARNYGVSSESFDAFQEAGIAPSLVRGIAEQRRRYLSRATTVVTPSRYLTETVRRWPGTPNDLRTIHNGIELGDYPDLPRERRGDRPMRVLFVGRLTNWKGVETLLLAARGLDGVEISIVGDGPELPMLQGFLAQLNASGAPVPARFLGRQSEAAVHAEMLSHDVLVLPSGYEGLSHTLLEACAARLVPVVSSVGGNQEVIDDKSHGLLVPYGDVVALNRALCLLRDDDALRLRLAAAARLRAGDFPFQATVDAYAALIEDEGA
jgi:glycosyltransferase involved in cell wall biosynthesis